MCESMQAKQRDEANSKYQRWVEFSRKLSASCWVIRCLLVIESWMLSLYSGQATQFYCLFEQVTKQLKPMHAMTCVKQTTAMHHVQVLYAISDTKASVSEHFFLFYCIYCYFCMVLLSPCKEHPISYHDDDDDDDDDCRQTLCPSVTYKTIRTRRMQNWWTYCLAIHAKCSKLNSTMPVFVLKKSTWRRNCAMASRGVLSWNNKRHIWTNTSQHKMQHHHHYEHR